MLRVLVAVAALLDLPSLDIWIDGEGRSRPTRRGPDAGVVHAVAVAGRPGGRRRSASNAEGRLGRRARRPRGERYRGEDEPIDPVPGHIPGSVSAERAANRDEQGRFLDPRRCAADTRASGFATTEARSSCGSGLTAAFGLFAMERAGLGLGRLYEGSWSDWVSDAARPVATGPEPGEPR